MVRKQDLTFLEKMHGSVAFYIGNVAQTLTSVCYWHASRLQVMCSCSTQEAAKVQKLSTMLDPEFERRSFMHECRNEFPGQPAI